jgi:hypothetical protein
MAGETRRANRLTQADVNKLAKESNGIMTERACVI